MPSSVDFGLAKEIAVGTTRRLLTLERLSLILAKRPRLKLRKKERAILYSAIYQHCFMSRIPTYALVNEAVKLANQHCFGNFPKFVNAVLRNMPADSGELLAQLPQGDDPASLSIRLSYPEYFVQSLCDQLGLEKAIEVMESMNIVPPIMARVINTTTPAEDLAPGLEPVTRLPPEAGLMVQITNREQLTFVNSSPNLYITNSTPVVLLARLCAQWRKAFDSEPKRVLDLCASPGGKTIGLASAFPSSDIFANDISLPKVSKMHANFARYGLGRIKCTMVRGELVAVGRSLPAKANNGHSAVSDLDVSVDELEATVPNAPSEELDLAQSLQSLNRDDLSTFDVVVVDAPCSNTGVLHKRPEARWRLSSPSIVQSLQATQLALMGSAAELVRPGGQIWYLTCSILPDENERLVDKACAKFGLERGPYEETILPSVSGADGGFASCLVKKA